MIAITNNINLLITFLFMSRIKLAEIQFYANIQNDNILSIINKIKWHAKMYNLSFFVIFGVILQYIGGVIYLTLEIDTPFILKIVETIWIVFINILIIVISIYYCLMIERFIRILSVSYQQRKCLHRVTIYTTIFGIICFNL